MTNPKIQAIDLVAVVIILSATFLLWQGVNHGISSILTLITGYYFGKRASNLPKE